MASDFLRDKTGDIACVNGDFVIGESLGQEVDAIMMASKCHYKENPLLGPSIIRHMRGNGDMLAIRREVAIAMELDNKKLQSITISADKQLKVLVK